MMMVPGASVVLSATVVGRSRAGSAPSSVASVEGSFITSSEGYAPGCVDA
jgi:hypothetical protein